jgi:hypothetical protein
LPYLGATHFLCHSLYQPSLPYLGATHFLCHSLSAWPALPGRDPLSLSLSLSLSAWPALPDPLSLSLSALPALPGRDLLSPLPALPYLGATHFLCHSLYQPSLPYLSATHFLSSPSYLGSTHFLSSPQLPGRDPLSLSFTLSLFA